MPSNVKRSVLAQEVVTIMKNISTTLPWSITVKLFLNYSGIFSGHFDTNRSMIPLSVPEISPWAVFVTDEEEELGILVVG